MDLQPVSPGLPDVTTALSLAENEISEMSAEIRPIAKEYKDLKKRLADFAIFADRVHSSGKTKKRVAVVYDSSPEEEIFLQHRTHYDETMRAIRGLNATIEKIVPDKDDLRLYLKMTHAVRLIEKDGAEHLQHMRKILESMRERQSDVERKMITIIQERARLAQAAMQHQDKMQLARGANMPTTDELLAQLAEKYQVPIAEVQALLAAKNADA